MKNKKADKYLKCLSEMKDEDRYLFRSEIGRPMMPGTRPWISYLRYAPKKLSLIEDQLYYFVACVKSVNKDGNVPVREAIRKAVGRGKMLREQFLRLTTSVEDGTGYFYQAVENFFGLDILKEIDAEELFEDLLQWNHPACYIQKKWVGYYYDCIDTNKEEGEAEE